MCQVNTRGCNKVVGVEEHVVISSRAIGRCIVSNVGDFGKVDWFRLVNNIVAVFVDLTGSVFVVIVPLPHNYAAVSSAIAEDVEGHCGIVVYINNTCSIRINAVECVSIILEVERNEIPTHRREINTRYGERFVCPCIAVTVGACIARVSEPIGVVVEYFLLAGVLIVDCTLRVLTLFVSVSVCSAFKSFLAKCSRGATVNVGRSCRIDRRLDIIINCGVSIVVGFYLDIKDSFSIQSSGVEVLKTLDHWVVKVEWSNVSNNFVVLALFIPSVS